jgi:sulfite reductase (ferredoxin)
MSPGAKATHPRLADPVCTVEPEHLEELVIAMVTIHRDHGNRSNRKFARLKYILEEWGVGRFKAELESRVGRKLAPPEPLHWNSGRDHFGWHAQGAEELYLGIPVLSGRVADEGGVSLRSALREAAESFRAGVRLTPQQNVLLTDIRVEDRENVERLLARRGVRLADSLPPVLRHAMACPAMPTCGLAITEAERAQPALLESIGRELREAGLDDAPVAIRTTGCPNGCARPYTAEIGIVGQSVNLYGIYLGGSDAGTRLGSLFAANVPREDIGERLRPVFDAYRAQRSRGESFGEFCARLGPEGLRALVHRTGFRQAGRKKRMHSLQGGRGKGDPGETL